MEDNDKKDKSKKTPLIRNVKELFLLCGILLFVVGIVLALFFDGVTKDIGMTLLGICAIFLMLFSLDKKKKGIKKVFYIVGVIFSVAAIGLLIAGLVTHEGGFQVLGIVAAVLSVIALLCSGEHLQLF
ncbi:MAG: hypothetical protein LBT20_04210 [Clostridiales bacterium]|jgi:hypothetical protein|nr:hypothetical protein [Clostridiales bacterium]